MPLVQARVNLDAINDDQLFMACKEIVPAGLNSPMGPLTPGSIVFLADALYNPDHIGVDVFLDIEAFDYEDRRPLDPRADAIRKALKECFPGCTFRVWPKLVNAGWSSDISDPEFDGDMSMEAAIERAKRAIGAGPAHVWESNVRKIHRWDS